MLPKVISHTPIESKSLSLYKIHQSSNDSRRHSKKQKWNQPNHEKEPIDTPVMLKGPVKIHHLPDNSSCIALLGSQEPSILSQLCTQQLNRIIELPPEVLQCLLKSCSENSSDKKAQRPLAAFIPQDMNNLNGGSSTFAERARSMLFPVSKGGPLRGRSPVPSGSRSVDLCASPSESDRLANQKKGHSGRAVTVSDVSTVNSLCQHLSANVEVEGLFRVPGNASRVQILKTAIANGSVSNILTNGPFTQHDVASALKSHLSNLVIFPANTQLAHLIVADSTFVLENERNQLKENSIKNQGSSIEHQPQSTPKTMFEQLPDSVTSSDGRMTSSKNKMTSWDLALTPSNTGSSDWKENEDVLYAFESQKKKQIEAVRVLFCLLTNNQRSLLKILFPLLYNVAKKQKTTRMSASNLATLFAPHFFRASKDISSKTSELDSVHRTCVENWDLTCYALTFMIRHWSKCLEVPRELNEQVVNYLAARNNINALNPAGVEETRSNIFKFMKKSSKDELKKQRSKSASTTVKNRPQSYTS